MASAGKWGEPGPLEWNVVIIERLLLLRRVRDKTVGRPDFESAEDMLEAMRREG